MGIHHHHQTKSSRRERASLASASSRPSPVGDADEYDRAVAFLREFRSRHQSLATGLHHASASSSLDGMLKTDGFEDLLCGDFSVGVSVDNGRKMKGGGKSTPAKRKDRPAKAASVGALRYLGRSGMKKARTARCLRDLDVSSTSSSGGREIRASPGLKRSPTAPAMPMPSLFPPQSPAPVAAGGDYCLGFDFDDVVPMATSCHGLLGFAS